MAKNIIAIDIGNTNTSVGLVDTENLSCKKSYTFHSNNIIEKILNSIKQLRSEYPTLDLFTVKICTVIRSIRQNLEGTLSRISYIDKVSFIGYHKNLPIKIHYENPGILGTDRIANLLYSFIKYKNENVIIIDAGTAITIDMLTSEKEFVGGFILPGVMTQLNSLHDNTSELPLVDYDKKLVSFPPNSTQSAILSGIYYEIAGGISFITEQLRKKYPDNKRILTCGGSWKTIDSFIDFKFEFIPEMTLLGVGIYEE